MKTLLSLSMAVLGFALIPALPAAEKEKHHSHDHEKRESGPNGGRVVFSVEPHFEFFVMPDRKVKITFLGEDKKAIAPTDQTVSAISGKRSKPTKMEFTREAGALVSDKPLPEGERVPIVLRVKASPDAKTVTEKFTVDMADCAECDLKEYACVCDHEH
ncbi:MAG: hypothetical protein GXX91_15445 [Verrucomicrobiaceae bacterium]|nr:hypothetical protein [Verrucomicrobiaceae bacterium]